MAECNNTDETRELLTEYEPISQGVLKAAHSIDCLQIEPTLHETLDADALDKIFQTSGNVNGRIVTQIWDMTAVITPIKSSYMRQRKLLKIDFGNSIT
ncbi:hypothetical protein [Natrarchaeobaculum sulfurireducens]|uniref:Uncharacterized protein n=1 Tax=Natrarchaeobaculum sulfurireducens TaxID=2044521 RepID=A0A346P9I4_9EURY|nr:hypothetical protein [Natrarchaeobaculum sulfurireducens]AXR76179.1 hypothetical protein AArc1_4062 [Natrarchaeobaculum sulfurireducens]